MFLVLKYAKNSNIEPKPWTKIVYIKVSQLSECKDAKNTMVISMDKTADNLRLSVYLKINRKKNMNGMNLRNSSVINENINGTTSNSDNVDCSRDLHPLSPHFPIKLKWLMHMQDTLHKGPMPGQHPWVKAFEISPYNPILKNTALEQW